MTNNGDKDALFARPRPHLVDFTFDERVAAVFPDMIRRSVPGYGDIIALTGLIGAQYAQPHSNCYDLGCSLGATTLSLRRRITAPGCRIVGVDNSGAMLERCRQVLAEETDGPEVELVCADIRTTSVENASVVVLNFTLQFVPPAERDALLTRISAGMRPGAVLVLSEKVAFGDTEAQAVMEELHLEFKRANGYSELEISQKRTALENVLVPETVDTHRERLERAGLHRVTPWYQCLNFASLLAFK